MTKNRRTLLRHLKIASQASVETSASTWDEELHVGIDSVLEDDVDLFILDPLHIKVKMQPSTLMAVWIFEGDMHIASEKELFIRCISEEVL